MSRNQKTVGQTLCDTCDRIDFSGYLEQKLDSPVYLGSWKRLLRQPKCPFCRLVVHCLRSDSRFTPYYPASDVYLDNKPSWELGVELSPYERTGSESYSNRFDLRSCSRRLQDTAYRFLITTNELGPGQAGHIQYLAHRETSLARRQFFGRKIQQRELDIKLLKSWFGRCREWHGNECDRNGAAGKELPRNLRLIDVITREIVRVPSHAHEEYVALSYVWGEAQMKAETGMEPARLKRADLTRYGREDLPLPKRIPRTIEDAIQLTRALGFRYLWNDALCIVQDSSEQQKALHLSRMHAIYTCAALTIAAAAGAHADHGIPGISVPRKRAQYTELINGLRFATMFPSYSELENSSTLQWNTRGWTFQEKLLSKRILLFTDFQVYFKCSESIWTEEVHMETDRLSKSVEARRGKYRWAPDRVPHAIGKGAQWSGMFNRNLNIDDGFEDIRGFLDYTGAVQEYTTRTLTDPKDVLFAIGGVLQTLVPKVGRFIFALAEDHLLESLMWSPEPGALQNPAPVEDLPSWSWAAWSHQGKPVSYDVRNNAELMELQRYFQAAIEDRSNQFFDESSGPDASAMVVGMRLMHSFRYPVMLSGHTVRQFIYCNDGTARLIEATPTMKCVTNGWIGTRLSFLGKFVDLTDNTYPHDALGMISSFVGASTRWKQQPEPSQTACQIPAKTIRSVKSPSLLFRTVVVSFTLGKVVCGGRRGPANEVAMFELLDQDGLCIGEVATTRSIADVTGGKPVSFLTISWSLSLQYATPHITHTPTWPSSDRGINILFSPLDIDKAGAVGLRAMESGIVGVLDGFTKSKGISLPDEWKAGTRISSGKPSGQLYNSILEGQHGDPLARALWPVVNVLLVSLTGQVARRLGAGRVLMSCWEAARSPARDIIFM